MSETYERKIVLLKQPEKSKTYSQPPKTLKSRGLKV